MPPPFPKTKNNKTWCPMTQRFSTSMGHDPILGRK